MVVPFDHRNRLCPHVCLHDETLIEGANVGNEVATVVTYGLVIGMLKRRTPLSRRPVRLQLAHT